jgi:hypothetical protein
MDRIRKPYDSGCYTSPLEPFRFYVPFADVAYYYYHYHHHRRKLFHTCPNKHCPSARCANAANVVGKDLDVFALGAVSLCYIYTHQPEINIIS